MSRPPGAAVPVIFGVASLVAALYSVGGYLMVSSFSDANPGYPGHARAATIWGATAILGATLAIICAVVAVRRIRALRAPK